MPLTRQHKIYGCVLALTLGGLAVDRFVVGYDQSGPSQAGAATDGAAPPRPAQSTASARTATPLAPTESTDGVAKPDYRLLAAQLDTLSFGRTEAEEAQLLARLFGSAVPDPTVDSASQMNEPAFDGQQFIRRHTLQAVMVSPQGSTAMINGRLRRIGDVVDGLTLTHIDARSVTLMQGSHGGRLQLRGR